MKHSYVKEYREKMYGGHTYIGIRCITYRHIPPRIYLGRPPAPWCPIIYSKTVLNKIVENTGTGDFDFWENMP